MTLRPFDKLTVALSTVEGRHAQGHPGHRRGMRVFGIDPGSDRTGYGCIDSDGRRHQLVGCGAVRAGVGATFPDQLKIIYDELTVLLAEHRPQCVAIENIFHAVNARSALKLGHARGVAMLAAIEAGVDVVEYTPAEIKRAVVGYGRAEKTQVAQMVKMLLGLDAIPKPHDATDALAVAICHLHSGAHANWQRGLKPALSKRASGAGVAKRWRDYRPEK